ncbi:RNA polymerase sigma-70 factor (ECF subfamily) [Paenibacillus taihuensis]|uniref:RNA polymerase sigma factor n=1 Tax=Paenibacillus taihuensis TaxID=1156355 RepID=A0A3D9R693_9BACL|nr:RNA polymerase sigma factor [Paenibacillus taihuensis]REE70613.1 RNA polymerase sigma-70 factor (ECF subfamily) [Paenibacillus taihuensis]
MTTKPTVDELRFVLYRYCLTLTQSTWDAEDLVQETCLRALPVMNGNVEHPNPTAYLLRVAKNISIDHLRRQQLARRTLERNEAVLTQLYGDSHEMEYAVRLLLAHLSPLQRTVFLLKELFGYKGTEVAAKLSTSEGAVKAALHRARSALARLKQREQSAAACPSTVLENQVSDSMLYAYVNVIRSADPNALIVLANAEEQLIDPVQAIGQLHVSSGIGSSVSMMMAA